MVSQKGFEPLCDITVLQTASFDHSDIDSYVLLLYFEKIKTSSFIEEVLNLFRPIRQSKDSLQFLN